MTTNPPTPAIDTPDMTDTDRANAILRTYPEPKRTKEPYGQYVEGLELALYEVRHKIHAAKMASGSMMNYVPAYFVGLSELENTLQMYVNQCKSEEKPGLFSTVCSPAPAADAVGVPGVNTIELSSGERAGRDAMISCHVDNGIYRLRGVCADHTFSAEAWWSHTNPPRWCNLGEGLKGFGDEGAHLATAAELHAAGIKPDDIADATLRADVAGMRQPKFEPTPHEPVEGVKLFQSRRQPDLCVLRVEIDGVTAGSFDDTHIGNGAVREKKDGVIDKFDMPNEQGVEQHHRDQLAAFQDSVRAARKAEAAEPAPERSPLGVKMESRLIGLRDKLREDRAYAANSSETPNGSPPVADWSRVVTPGGREVMLWNESRQSTGCEVQFGKVVFQIDDDGIPFDGVAGLQTKNEWPLPSGTLERIDAYLDSLASPPAVAAAETKTPAVVFDARSLLAKVAAKIGLRDRQYVSGREIATAIEEVLES